MRCIKEQDGNTCPSRAGSWGFQEDQNYSLPVNIASKYTSYNTDYDREYCEHG